MDRRRSIRCLSAKLPRDGRALAFLAEVSRAVRSYGQPDRWVLGLTRGAAPKNLTDDLDFGASRTGAPVALIHQLIISTPTAIGDLWMLDARADLWSR